MKRFSYLSKKVLKDMGVSFGSSGASSAADVTYSNTSSGLSATNVQAAIDEVVSDIPEIKSDTISGNTGMFGVLTIPNGRKVVAIDTATLPDGIIAVNGRFHTPNDDENGIYFIQVMGGLSVYTNYTVSITYYYI